jgi:hypothetical protein
MWIIKYYNGNKYMVLNAYYSGMSLRANAHIVITGQGGSFQPGDPYVVSWYRK